ncbi:RHS repeat-associated core domain-containing protein [Butyrivibrio sp. MC2021]|uniref:RHS repeat-associated core domain-containing protein n=1 Tax=Butyrivibrio sp. MC2021 TaxID=1408306 RepID=UPI000688B2FB|nr:RHS repeat-associated core domain-containing protein [Butyrivibrio sp. MC2021]
MLLAEVNPDYRISYYYDASGIATEIGYSKKDNGKYAKEEYFFFARNGQGDIVGIYRSADSTLVGSYEYDLWGNPVSVIENTTKKVNGKTVTIRDEQGTLEKNPLRYRGYYYDKETGFYYLNARYYDPKVHKFITPEPNFKVGKFDKNTGLNAYNLFAYCGNDPINLADQTGEFVITTTMLVVGICAAIGLTIGGIIGNVAADKRALPAGIRHAQY